MVFQERTYSVLIVTASERFTDSIMPLLPMTDYWPVSTVGSVGQARHRGKHRPRRDLQIA